MKAKDQQQKDTNPSPKWYFMAIKQPRQAHQGSSPCLQAGGDALAIETLAVPGRERCLWDLST